MPNSLLLIHLQSVTMKRNDSWSTVKECFVLCVLCTVCCGFIHLVFVRQNLKKAGLLSVNKKQVCLFSNWCRVCFFNFF